MSRQRANRWTPARAARAAYLAGRGWSYEQIADEIGGISGKWLGVKLRAWGARASRRRKGLCLIACLSPIATSRLTIAAKARGVPLDDLAAKILSVVACENLTDSILDDGVKTMLGRDLAPAPRKHRRPQS
ncbi:hypothetical protein BJ122_102234 [Rhodopseudomonas faecalis]|uniref:Uncharacterized protein n=1 Tax=Rhodopseudomonas faecalis TaxID=99655 RepID=A0A318TPS6_9BRAD|nr:hypothetical protein BJ122_102234 [Rhodopseudomonas faecalis]